MGFWHLGDIWFCLMLYSTDDVIARNIYNFPYVRSKGGQFILEVTVTILTLIDIFKILCLDTSVSIGIITNISSVVDKDLQGLKFIFSKHQGCNRIKVLSKINQKSTCQNKSVK